MLDIGSPTPTIRSAPRLRASEANIERQREIAARLNRFVASHDARDLWPEVPIAAFCAGQDELARIVVAALNGASAPISLRLPAGSDARALGVAAYAGNIGALVGYWCETRRVVAEPSVAALFATHLDHGRRRAARLRDGFERVLTGFADRGIDVCVLKGMHTGSCYFPEPGVRTASDIDLLVRPDDWTAARRVLYHLGFTEAKLAPGDVSVRSDTITASPDWDPGVIDTLELSHAGHPWSIDLHRSLDFRPFPGLTASFGVLDLTALDVWHEFSHPVRVLPQPLLLAYLALHASHHFYTMTQGRLAELALVARRDFAGDPTRWQAFVELVGRTGTGRFVFPALELAERFIPGTIDAGVLANLASSSPWWLRRIVRTTSPARAQRLHPCPGLRERLVWVASLGDVLVALAWLVWPRDGERPASPRRALGAQWRRVRRAVRRIVRARFAR